MLKLLKYLWIRLIVQCRGLIEFIQVLFRYYSNFEYFKQDVSLLKEYFLISPYYIHQSYSNDYTYGETPLTTLEYIASNCKIESTDKVFEIGCGRGRSCFWLHHFLNCQVVGIDLIPEFIEKALSVKNRYAIQGLDFRKEDMLETDYSGATVIYCYGSTFSPPLIKRLGQKLKELPSSTKIISISYPLNDFIPNENPFETIKRFPAQFVWGVADVYIQVIIPKLIQ